MASPLVPTSRLEKLTEQGQQGGQMEEEQLSSHSPEPPPPLPRYSTETMGSHTARFSMPAGSVSSSSLWKLKTRSLWTSITSRETPHRHALPTGRSAWEWLSMKHSRMTSRLIGTSRPTSSSTEPRFQNRQGFLGIIAESPRSCKPLTPVQLKQCSQF